MENPNSIWAGAFLDELARSGVRIVSVSPGSRSTPLVLAVAQDPRFDVFSIVDERSAGFFALGVGKATGVPAAVITTSGTAGANLYPAVVESSQSDVPLLLLTADRPHRLRDTDGNQAMDQLRLFGTFPRAFLEVSPVRMGDKELKHLRAQACRAVALAQGPVPGPVHLNFPFEKPLEPGPEPPGPRGNPESADPPQASLEEGESAVPGELALWGRAEGEPFTRVQAGQPVLSGPEIDDLFRLISDISRGVLVVGPTADGGRSASAALKVGAAMGFPVLADPLSGARFGPNQGAHVVGGYDLFLRSEMARNALKPGLILRVGASPTSSSLSTFLQGHEGVPQLILDSGHRWKDHLATGHAYFRAPPGPLLEELARKALEGDQTPPTDAEALGWRGQWRVLEQETLGILDAQSREEMLEGWILESAAEILPAGANVLVASSMPIRDLDAFGRPRQEPLRVHGNRGTSGIDGLVSTTLGIAAASDGPTVGILGDLAFFHDMNGLLALKREPRPVGFVVVNNDGGGIFHTLPVRAHEPAFTRFFATPHGLDFSTVAELYGLDFFRTQSTAGFQAALPRLLDAHRPFLLEVVSDREESHGRRGAMIQRVIEAVDEALGGS